MRKVIIVLYGIHQLGVGPVSIDATWEIGAEHASLSECEQALGTDASLVADIIDVLADVRAKVKSVKRYEVKCERPVMQ